ncbi:MAG: glycosyltransferase [Deltaproteobacteria bacterium]|nr:glycosyltransferase [Deltaproteobacteria bacterium]
MTRLFTIFIFTLGFIYFSTLLVFLIGLLKFRNGGKDTRSYENPGHSVQPFVSVIVVARNEEEYLPACVESLLAQSYSSERYEVILVDDRSTDNTYNIMEAFSSAHPHLKALQLGVTEREQSAVHEQPPATDSNPSYQQPTFSDVQYKRMEAEPSMTGKQRGLDFGVSVSCGDFILTTDADCFVPPMWVEGMVKAFSPSVGMVVGFSMLCENNQTNMRQKPFALTVNHQSAYTCDSTTQCTHILHRLFLKLQSLELLTLFCASAGSLNMGVALACTGNNLGYRRQVYEELGGFAELGFTVAEDNIFLQWVNRYSQWQIQAICHPDVTVLTRPMKSIRSFFRQRLRWASNSLANRRSLSCFMVVVYGFYLFIPIALILAISGAFPWTLLLAVFAIKMLPEFFLVLRGLQLFDRMDLLKYFLLLEPCQAVYVLICGICGLPGKGIWKGRRYDR